MEIDESHNFECTNTPASDNGACESETFADTVSPGLPPALESSNQTVTDVVGGAVQWLAEILDVVS